MIRYRHGLRPTYGLIGTIGSGKSTMASLLTKHGAAVIDADRIGHAILDEPAVRSRLTARWGDSILNADGRIDRRAVGRIVFADPAEKQALEVVVHPLIHDAVLSAIDASQRDPRTTMVIVDAPLLLEAGWRDLVDGIVFIDAPWPERVRRVAERNGWGEAELKSREANQLPAGEKRQQAMVTILNDGTIDKLEHTILDFHGRYGVTD